MLMKKETFMGSVEAPEVTQKPYSDMLPKHFLEDTSMAL